MKRIRTFFASLMPAGLAGAFLMLVLGRINEPGEANRIVLLLVGWLYGVGVLALIRLFRVHPGLYPLIGLVCGPVPFALIANRDMDPQELGGVWALTAILGAIIGAVEWGRLRRLDADPEL